MRTLSLTQCVVDLATGALTHPADGRPLGRLTTRELTLLGYLARADRVVTRRELLVDAFGYHDAAESRAVDKAMSSLRSKVEGDPRSPAHLVTIGGEGYRFVAAPDPPAPAEGFVGRAADVAAVGSMLESPGVVTLVGPAGVGKTRLAHELVRARPGARWVELAGARGRDDVLRAVAVALGVPTGGDASAERIGHALASHADPVLVLDNLEHLRAHADLIEEWRALAPTSRILGTSREPLGLVSERIHRVEPLHVDASVALVTHCASRAGLALADDELALLPELVTRLDGLPLALELAAARFGVLGPRGMLDRLPQRNHLLAARDGRDRRHASLADALDGSWWLLDGAGRTALAELSVFPTDFGADAAEAVCSDPGDGRVVLDVLERLYDASLLRRRSVGGRVRLSLLETVRLFAADRLDELGSDVVGRAQVAYVRHYAEVARVHTCLRGPGGAAQMARLQLEGEHLVAACRAAPRLGEGAAAVALLETLDRMVTLWGSQTLLADLARPVLEMPGGPRQRLVARCALARGLAGSDRPQAEREARLALAEATELGEVDLEERAAYRLGLLLQYTGRVDDAEALFRARPDSAVACWNLGLLAQFRGKFEHALEWMERSRSLAVGAGDLLDAARADHSAAMILLRLERFDEAERRVAACAPVFEAWGARPGVLHNEAILGQIMARRGELAAGCDRLRRAVDGLRALGDRRSVMALGAELGGLLLDEGRVDEAEVCFAETEAIAGSIGERRVLAAMGVPRVRTLLARGRPAEAVAVAERFRREVDFTGFEVLALTLELSYAQALLQASRPQQARAVGTELERQLESAGLGPTTELGAALAALMQQLGPARLVRGART